MLLMYMEQLQTQEKGEGNARDNVSASLKMQTNGDWSVVRVVHVVMWMQHFGPAESSSDADLVVRKFPRPNQNESYDPI